MRYLAILKDSLRETRDSWVLLGLFVLTTLVILFVASIGFKQQTAQKTMEMFFSPLMHTALNYRKPEKKMRHDAPWAQFRLEDVKLLDGEADSPLSEYALTVVPGGRFGGPPEAVVQPPEKPGGEPKAPKIDHDGNIKQLRKVFEDAETLDYIKIEQIEPIANAPGARAPRYLVKVKGTQKTHRIWATEPSIFFGAFSSEEIALPLSFLLYMLASSVISFGSWIAVLLGIIISAFFIPNMLRKGTIDLLLVKPISRPTLLGYKYLGGLTFIFLTTAYAIAGIWLVLGLRSGLWPHGTLLLIFTLTFFAILYSVSTFVAVVTRSVVASILLTLIAWVVFVIIGWVYAKVDESERAQDALNKRNEVMKRPERPDEPAWVKWLVTGIRVLHAVSPRTEDLNQLNDLVVYTDFLSGNLGDMGQFDTSKRNWWESLFVSTIWIGIFLGLASLWFYFKDY